MYKNVKTSCDIILLRNSTLGWFIFPAHSTGLSLTQGLKMLHAIRPVIGTGNECFIEKIAMVTTECFNEKTSELGVIVGGILDL